jgi:hypothetical protein
MDKNTFKMFDYVYEHPKTDLNLCITSNCCPPGNQWDKFMISLKKITEKQAIDHFMLFCSLDSWGEQAAYIRDGMDFELLTRNINDFLTNGSKHSLTFIITFNALSYTGFETYLKNILELRRKHSNSRQLIWFDVPQLHTPEWLNPKILPEMIPKLERCLKFMEENQETPERRFKGFKDFEISKVLRLIDWLKTPAEFDVDTQMKNFYLYFTEHDRRRGTDFLTVFPDLKDFWTQCKEKNGS